MFEFLQKKLALSRKGAVDFLKGVFMTTLLDMALMIPAIYVFMFLDQYLNSMQGANSASDNRLLYYTLLGAGFMVVMYIIAVFQYRSTYTTIYDESANRRISLAEKIRKLPLAFFGEKNLSDLTSTIMEDCTELEHTFSHAVPQLYASIISVFIIAAGMFFYNWQLSLALFWVVPIAFAIIMVSRKKLHDENRILYRAKRDVTERIQEGLDNVQEIKSYCREDSYIKELCEVVEGYERQLIKGELMAGAMVNSAQSFLKLGLATVIFAGANLLASGSINLLVYLVFLMVGSRIYNPISEVFNNMAALFYLDIRINRMNEMEALPVQQGTTNFIPEQYDLSFENVDFSYEDGKPVLRNVTFSARQGEVTALIGPSGSGKSTAAKLAARFWDINGGRILLGGNDISVVDPETLLKYYSIVFQDVVLFNTSIADNIRIGKADATDEEVLRAAEQAQCEEFVQRMPHGYNTVIGENGETLSGGERQRISIARAILKDAPIVLLDEATASLDVENETRIQRAISELVKDKTVLIIAHRMRTVACADKIIALKKGEVEECGSPDELKSRGGLFSKMLERQMVEV